MGVPMRPSPADPPVPPIASSAWRLLVLLTALNVLNFVVRQLIPSLAPLLIADLGLTRAQIGALVGFAFVVGYSIVGLLLGIVADRWPRRRIVAGGLTLWSAMTALSGLARRYLALAVPRVFSGMGQAALAPSALAMLGDAFPARRLGLASGIYYAGLPIGTGVSLALAGWVAPRYGWRACFFVVGFAGLGALALVAAAREPARRGREGHASAVGPHPTLLGLARDVRRAIGERPALLLVMVGSAALAYASAAATHGVTWLVQERGFSFTEAAWLSGAMAVASGFVGNLAGGWFSDWCARRGPGGRAWSLVWMTVFFTPFAAGFFVLTPGTTAFYACWFLEAASTVAYFGPVFSAIQEMAPGHVRAGLLGVALLVLNLAGIGPGALVTGALGDESSLSLGLLVSVGVALAGAIPFALGARVAARSRGRATR